MGNTDPIGMIVGRLDEKELLCQLAEEASELSQAALKLRRAYDGTNPTPKSERECFEQLIEEMCDVCVCCTALGLDTRENRRRMAEIMQEKIMRWAARLEEEDAE